MDRLRTSAMIMDKKSIDKNGIIGYFHNNYKYSTFIRKVNTPDGKRRKAPRTQIRDASYHSHQEAVITHWNRPNIFNIANRGWFCQWFVSETGANLYFAQLFFATLVHHSGLKKPEGCGIL